MTPGRYEGITETISEGEHTDPQSIVQQIARTITALYCRRFPEAAANECDDIVTYISINIKTFSAVPLLNCRSERRVHHFNVRSRHPLRKIPGIERTSN